MLTTHSEIDRNRVDTTDIDPKQIRSFLDVIQAQDDLARLTLRQLRQKASSLGVPLYSRKSKVSLIKEISLVQKKDSAKRDPSSGSTSTGSLETRVVFLPRDPQWAYVFWEISESDREEAASQGANRLFLRLSDVTGAKDGGSALKQALQEVPVDSHSTEWYLPIPLSDRDYRVELGYRSSSRWISLAVSSQARVPSIQPTDQILDQFVPFSLEGGTSSGSTTQEVANELIREPENIGGLHESLYQSATTHFRTTRGRIGSEEFQEHGGGRDQKGGPTDSGSGLWASGRNVSGLGGVPSRQRSFWLVADAELLVYGSTDPAAKLTIGGEDVPLASDGTFRLQVPFRDGVQQYAIEATISDGEQKRNVTMQFERKTPEDNTNLSEQAAEEWF